MNHFSTADSADKSCQTVNPIPDVVKDWLKCKKQRALIGHRTGRSREIT